MTYTIKTKGEIIKMDEMDIVIKFAKLWGIETEKRKNDKHQYEKMESYDSKDLLNIFIDWKNEYMNDEIAEDASDFFYEKFNSFIA